MKTGRANLFAALCSPSAWKQPGVLGRCLLIAATSPPPPGKVPSTPITFRDSFQSCAAASSIALSLGRMTPCFNPPLTPSRGIGAAPAYSFLAISSNPGTRTKRLPPAAPPASVLSRCLYITRMSDQVSRVRRSLARRTVVSITRSSAGHTAGDHHGSEWHRPRHARHRTAGAHQDWQNDRRNKPVSGKFARISESGFFPMVRIRSRPIAPFERGKIGLSWRLRPSSRFHAGRQQIQFGKELSPNRAPDSISLRFSKNAPPSVTMAMSGAQREHRTS